MGKQLPPLDVLTIDGIQYEVVDTKGRQDVTVLNQTVVDNKTAADESIADLESRKADKVALEEESNARSTADEALSERIDANGEQISELSQSKADKTQIESEAQARITGDNALSQALAEEIETRTTNDENTSARLANDEALITGLSNDKADKTALTAEETARTEADTILQQSIDKAEEDIETLSSSKADKTEVENETSARLEADAALDTRLTAVENDKATKTALENEASARVAQDNAIIDLLNQEASIRATSDEETDGRLDSLEGIVEELNENKANKTQVETDIAAAKAELFGLVEDTIDSNTILGLKNALNALSRDLTSIDENNLETINKLKAELIDPTDESGIGSFLDKLTTFIAGFELDSTSENYITVKAYIDAVKAALQEAIDAINAHLEESNFVKTVDYEDDQEVIADALNDLEERKADKADLEALETTVNENINTKIEQIEEVIDGLDATYVTKADYDDDQEVVARALNDLEDRKADKTAVDEALAGKANNSALDDLAVRTTAVENTVASKADQEDLDALEGVVATKANNSTVVELIQTVNGKADQESLDNLSDVVAQKASQRDIEALQADVNSKASQEDLESLEDVVGTKADQDGLTALQSVVATKASQADLEALTPIINAKANQSEITRIDEELNDKVSSDEFAELNTAVAAKAENDDLVALEQVVSTKASQADVEALQTTLNSKANQSVVDELSAEVDTKASQEDLEDLEDTINNTINTKIEQIEEVIEGLDQTYVKIEDYEKDERVIAASLNDLNDRKADKTELNALTEVVNTKASQADMTAVQQDIADIKGTDADTSSANSIIGLRKAIDNLSQTLTGADASTIEILEKIQQELTNPSANGSLVSFLDTINAAIAGFQWEDPTAPDYTGTIKDYIDNKVAAEHTEMTTAIAGVNSSIANLESSLDAETSAREAADEQLQEEVNSKMDANELVQKDITYITNAVYENGEISISTHTETVWVPKPVETPAEPEEQPEP